MEIKAFENEIELKNNGELSLFFVGAGSAFSKKYFQTNLIITKGDAHILVDCGTMCPYVMEAVYKTPVTKIKNLIVTHLHADHMGGIEEMILLGRYVTNRKVNIVITDKFKKQLWNNSLKGGNRYSDNGPLTFDDYFTQEKPKLITKKPFEIWEYQIDGLNIKLFRTLHVTEKPLKKKHSQFSQGLIIDDKVLFTGDTQFNKPQLDWILQNFNIEAIFHDCDISDRHDGVHATYHQLNTLDSKTKEKIYLCHYNSKMETVNAEADGFAGFIKKGQYYIFK